MGFVRGGWLSCDATSIVRCKSFFVHFERHTKQIVSSSSFTNDAISIFVRDNPRYRLPYLYSLAITLSHGVGVDALNPLEVFGLLMAPGQDPSDDRILDTNILVVAALKFILRQSQSGILEPETKGQPPSQVAQILELVQHIIERAESPGRLRWKSIYLLADVVTILPQLGIDTEENEQLKVVIDNAVEAAKNYLAEQELGDACEHVPSDWRMKRDASERYGLVQAVERLAALRGSGEAVYKWRGSIPYLNLYRQQTPADPTSQAPYRWIRKLQQ